MQSALPSENIGWIEAKILSQEPTWCSKLLESTTITSRLQQRPVWKRISVLQTEGAQGHAYY